MTHDELLAEIDIQLLHLPSYFHDKDKTILGMKALRAVVELATTETVNISENGERFYDGFHYALKCVIETIEEELQ